jgi:Protein of unknown function (DUF1579)
MEMPTLNEHHRRLAKLVGSWKGEEKLSPSPWDPAGGTAIGTVRNQTALDGFAVIQDYEQQRNGAVTFRGHGVFTWDSNQGSYVLHWFDSMGMPPNDFRGSFEGEVLSLTNKGPMGLSRCSFDLREPNAYRFRMEVSPDGKQWQTFMEGKYQKEK